MRLIPSGDYDRPIEAPWDGSYRLWGGKKLQESKRRVRRARQNKLVAWWRTGIRTIAFFVGLAVLLLLLVVAHLVGSRRVLGGSVASTQPMVRFV
jgi:uncharacterized membrane protein YidH (DUF202 family)